MSMMYKALAFGVNYYRSTKIPAIISNSAISVTDKLSRPCYVIPQEGVGILGLFGSSVVEGVAKTYKGIIGPATSEKVTNGPGKFFKRILQKPKAQLARKYVDARTRSGKHRLEYDNNLTLGDFKPWGLQEKVLNESVKVNSNPFFDFVFG